MSYNEKYPDMSAMYAVQFEYENKLKDKIKELETELERTHKALGVAVDALKEISLHYQNELDKPVAPEKWFRAATTMCDYADEALEQINQKENQ